MIELSLSLMAVVGAGWALMVLPVRFTAWLMDDSHLTKRNLLDTEME